MDSVGAFPSGIGDVKEKSRSDGAVLIVICEHAPCTRSEDANSNQIQILRVPIQSATGLILHCQTNTFDVFAGEGLLCLSGSERSTLLDQTTSVLSSILIDGKTWHRSVSEYGSTVKGSKNTDNNSQLDVIQ